MAVTSIAEFLDLLKRLPLLDPTRLEHLIDHPSRFADLPDLTRELVRRGWLTSFQIERLLQETGGSLIVGPYVLLERLGEGCTGEVYKARHERLGRLIALKVMHRGLPSPVTVKLEHGKIVAVQDVGQVGDTHYIAMELVRGIDLAQLLKQHGPLPEVVACNFVRQTAIGLQHAYEQGLFHGDIKPSHLMVTLKDDGESTIVKILDFNQTDVRTDILGLGCTLFYLLTGKLLFPQGEESASPVQQVTAQITPELKATLAKMLAGDPADRFQTPAEVATALEPFAHIASLPPALLAAIQGPDDNVPTVAAADHDLPKKTPRLGHLLFWGIGLAIVIALCLAAYYFSRLRP
jgi:serine/threonine-protein kinase